MSSRERRYPHGRSLPGPEAECFFGRPPIHLQLAAGERYRFFLKPAATAGQFVSVLDGTIDDDFACKPCATMRRTTAGRWGGGTIPQDHPGETTGYLVRQALRVCDRWGIASSLSGPHPAGGAGGRGRLLDIASRENRDRAEREQAGEHCCLGFDAGRKGRRDPAPSSTRYDGRRRFSTFYCKN